jgi:hypothetical protein
MEYVNYVVFDEAGEIRRAGSCAFSDFEHQGPAEFLLEGEGSRSTHWVLNRTISPYTNEQRAAKAARNTDPAKNWSNVAMAYV